jgi:hypothetical protein
MRVEGCKMVDRTKTDRCAGIWNGRKAISTRLWIFSVWFLLLPSLGFGEEPDSQEFQRVTHEFGEVPFWQNQQGFDRIPASEKLLLGIPIRRDGFTPRLSVTEHYTDNVFFTAGSRSTDWITKISPGLGYNTSGSKGELSVDYSFESRIYANNTNENTPASRHNGEVFGQWNLSNRTTLNLFDRFESFQDPTEQSVPGVLTTFGRTSINLGFVGVKHRLTSSIDLLANYGNFLWALDRSRTGDSMTHEGEFGVRLRGTSRSRTTAKYRLRHFDFSEGEDFQSHAASVTQEWEITETLFLSGAIGAVYVGPRAERAEPLAQASVKVSLKDVILEGGYFRDVFPPSGGISQPLVSDFLRASTKVRIANGVLLDGAVGWVLTNSASDDAQLRTLRFGMGLSYSPKPWFVVRLGYDRVQQREELSTTDVDRFANKVSLRLTATY